MLYVYTVHSLYTFSTFFPSEPSFLQQKFKGALLIEYAQFQNAYLLNSYLLMKLSTLSNQFLRVALHIYLLQNSRDNILLMFVNFVVDEVKIKRCVGG